MIHGSVHLPSSGNIGEYVVIEEGVKLGEHVTIGHHTVILKDTQVGDHVSIGSHSVLGIQPKGNKQMRRSQFSVPKKLIIQSNSQIGNHVTIYSGTVIDEEVFIADQASIRENAFIGKGTVIGRGAMIELNTAIGAYCTIQTLAYVTGDTILEDHVFLGPCVSMSNDKYMGAEAYTLKGPHIREGAKIGNNASLLPGITVGKHAVVGAGSVVTKNVSDFQTVAGVPAREIKKRGNNNDQECKP